MKTLKSIISLMLISVFTFSCTSNSDNELTDPNETNQTTEKSASAKTVVEVVKSHLKSDGSFYNQLNPESSMTFDLGFQFSYPVILSYHNGTKVVVNSIEQLASVAKAISQTNYIDGINFPFDIDKEGIKETVFTETDFGMMVNSKDTDGDGTPNYQDTDDDGDGASDISEDQNHDGDYTNDDADNDGDPNYLDTDSDNDGQADEDEDNDGDGDFTNDDSDGDGEADYTDTDSDNDGAEDGDDEDDDNDGTNDSDESYNGGNGTDGSYIDTASLPQIILDYIAQNYPNTSIIEAEVEDNGEYEVYLSNGVELYFNSNGGFLTTGNDNDSGDDNDGSDDDNGSGDDDGSGDDNDGSDDDNGSGDDDGSGDDNDGSDDDNGSGDDNDDNDNSNIDAASLLQTILDYVTNNYPNASITKAEIKSNGHYEVTLNNGVELNFDQNGNFLSVDND